MPSFRRGGLAVMWSGEVARQGYRTLRARRRVVVTNLVNKIPGLGDIPILGAFFKSKSLQKSNGELMVLCTVRKVSPSSQPTTGPNNPESRSWTRKQALFAQQSGRPFHLLRG